MTEPTQEDLPGNVLGLQLRFGFFCLNCHQPLRIHPQPDKRIFIEPCKCPTKIILTDTFGELPKV